MRAHFVGNSKLTVNYIRILSKLFGCNGIILDVTPLKLQKAIKDRLFVFVQYVAFAITVAFTRGLVGIGTIIGFGVAARAIAVHITAAKLDVSIRRHCDS